MMGRLFTGLIGLFLLLAVLRTVGSGPFQGFLSGVLPGTNNRISNNNSSTRSVPNETPPNSSRYSTQPGSADYTTNPPPNYYSRPPQSNGDGAVPAYW
jgi:hypothetical protein